MFPLELLGQFKCTCFYRPKDNQNVGLYSDSVCALPNSPKSWVIFRFCLCVAQLLQCWVIFRFCLCVAQLTKKLGYIQILSVRCPTTTMLGYIQILSVRCPTHRAMTIFFFVLSFVSTLSCERCMYSIIITLKEAIINEM